MVTVPTSEPSPSGPKFEYLVHIDMGKLSQSELHSLSLCSDSAFDVRRTDDVVIPQIDRTVFNESAASRRQTYALPRDSSSAGGHRSRLPGLLPHHRVPLAPAPDDPDRKENKSIVDHLKQLIAGIETRNSPTDQLLPPPLSQPPVVSRNADVVPQPINVDTGRTSPQDMQIVLYSGERKRKRGRKTEPRAPENDGEVQLEIANKNGAAVDLKALENADDFYGAELRRRTVGLETEEELLGFLRNLEGEWGSRRKKRKFIDAGEFGDALPVGWKLLLALKRKYGGVSLYCRKYISPTGLQFSSCKVASSYLQSYFGRSEASEPLSQLGGNNVVHFVNPAGCVKKNTNLKQNNALSPALPSSSIPAQQEMDFNLAEIDNLPDVQVRDLFECYKCNLAFVEKVKYLKHVMKFHQTTTRRFTFGSSMGKGLVVKQGNYECETGHEVFQERKSYDGHVGTHRNNNSRTSKELIDRVTVQKRTGSLSEDGSPPRLSKMDALIEIAQNSVMGTSTAEPDDKTNDGSPHDTMEVETIPEKVNGDHLSHVENSTFENSKVHEVVKPGNSQREVGPVNSQVTSTHDVITVMPGQTVQENLLQRGLADSSIPALQPLHAFPAFTTISNKVENKFFMVDQKLDNTTGFDELRMDELEALKFSFVNEHDALSLPLDGGFNSSSRFEPEADVNLAARCQFTTVCVWCRTEFSYEAVDSETQPDSVGFMCPACKAQISGQLDWNFSMGSCL